MADSNLPARSKQAIKREPSPAFSTSTGKQTFCPTRNRLSDTVDILL